MPKGATSRPTNRRAKESMASNPSAKRGISSALRQAEKLRKAGPKVQKSKKAADALRTRERDGNKLTYATKTAVGKAKRAVGRAKRAAKVAKK